MIYVVDPLLNQNLLHFSVEKNCLPWQSISSFASRYKLFWSHQCRWQVINSLLLTSLLLSYKRAGCGWMLQRGQSSSHKNELCQSLCCSFCVGSVSFGLSPKIVHDILYFRCAAGDDVARKPKLFYVSTSVTTSTLQTVSICYITSGTTITTCTGRKRRSIKIDVAQHAADVKPSQLNQKVQSSQKEAEKHREGRFLLYWITTTSISTSTSYTTTISVSAIECTRSDTTLCG